MSILPTVRAALAERFIFNFRLTPQRLASYLPVPWLTPQDVRGFGVASFCILDLRGITLAPLSTAVGLDSISCAPRYAVMDVSREHETPAVFVTERHTDSAFGAWFTRLGFPASHPHMEAIIDHQEGKTMLRVQSKVDGLLFAATVRPSADLNSSLFASSAEFGDFIAQGISSYGSSRHGPRLTKVDLHKEDSTYLPLAASGLSGAFVDGWQGDGGVFDSAFHTQGGRYEWTYRGMTER